MTLAILETRNYGRFELHPFNRDVDKTRHLEASMQKYGWLDAYPMHVIKNGSGRLLIKAGHTRFEVAKKLGIPVKYVVCDDTATIHELEKATERWTLGDYLTSFVRCGKEDYLTVFRFHKTTGISLMACISMLGGHSAGSGNFNDVFKDGTYKTKNMEHAGIVADIILHCKKCGIKWAANSLFVNALSRTVWAEGFEPSILKRKISAFPYLMEKQPNLVSYSEMIESLYNHHSQQKIPLSFLADEAARKRSAVKISEPEEPEKKKVGRR